MLGDGAQHELLRAKHRVEDRERRGCTLARIAVRAEAARSTQVARAVGRTAARRVTVERVERIGVRVVGDAEIPGRRGAALDHLRTRADEQIAVRRHGDRVVAVDVGRGRGEHRAVAASIACTVTCRAGDSTMAAGLRPLPSVASSGIRSNVMLAGDRDADGRRVVAAAPPPPPPHADSTRPARAATAAARSIKKGREFVECEVIFALSVGVALAGASRSITGAPNLPQHALQRKPSPSQHRSGGPRAAVAVALELERPFRDRRQLFAQRQHLVLPVAWLDEPRKRRGERRVAPSGAPARPNSESCAASAGSRPAQALA